MINNNFLFWMSFLIVAIFISLNIDKIKNFFSKLLFEKSGKKVETMYICPRCGSRDWKFANPLSYAEGTINIPQMVNQMYECMKCGFIGTFFKIDKQEVGKLKVKKQKTKQSDFNLFKAISQSIMIKRGILKGFIIFAIFSCILIFFLTDLYIFAAAVFGLTIYYKYYRGSTTEKKARK
jgi:hypothetical protein